MQLTPRLPKSGKPLFWFVLTAMLGIAFLQGYRTTHDLHWAYDTDFDRDIAFVRGNLEGQYGKDPNYRGEYLWYNPLLFSIETGIVKVTGLPVNIVVTRAGVYLNILAPLAFALMLFLLFGPEICLAGTACFLFFASGNIPGYGAATYSPWLYPVCFVQFLFYCNVIFLYLALSRKKWRWFVALGVGTGISFLGHMGPTFVTVLMTVALMTREIWLAGREKNTRAIWKLLGQGVAMVVPFLVVASPLLIFVVGKYELHTINQAPANYNAGPYDISYPLGMLKANLSFSLLIAIVGGWSFYKHYKQLGLARLVILAWTGVALTMYLYTSMVKILLNHGITLPSTVPAFHYYFYLKSLQSVYFAFGWMYLLRRPVSWIYLRLQQWTAKPVAPVDYFGVFSLVILAAAIGYFPIYRQRADFTELRKDAQIKESNHDRMGVYYYIVENIPSSSVILSDREESIFPVMASARKMVAIETTFSNPFVSYEERNSDRSEMLASLKRPAGGTAAALFSKYDVRYILLSQKDVEDIKKIQPLPGKVIYQNPGYVIVSL